MQVNCRRNVAGSFLCFITHGGERILSDVCFRAYDDPAELFDFEEGLVIEWIGDPPSSEEGKGGANDRFVDRTPKMVIRNIATPPPYL